MRGGLQGIQQELVHVRRPLIAVGLVGYGHQPDGEGKLQNPSRRSHVQRRRWYGNLGFSPAERHMIVYATCLS